ncbi:MAG: radical SAM protein, partial [Marinobacter sp.]|nr:radical SAM protein [Marinobacter sp.]
DKPGYRPSPIALGMNTDAYQPIEREHRITRSLLEVMRDYHHPVSIITKGGLILRDLDLLTELASDNLCSVRISLTTLDNDLKRRMEPRTAAPATRLALIRKLSGAGVPVGIILGPVIPFVNDHEIEGILEAASEAGARQASWIMLRLPYELDELFQDWLQRHFPERASHVMNRIRDLRGGRSYDSTFGRRMTGTGPYAELIRQRFRQRARKLGLNLHQPEPLRTDLFRRPGGEQMVLW